MNYPSTAIVCDFWDDCELGYYHQSAPYLENAGEY